MEQQQLQPPVLELRNLVLTSCLAGTDARAYSDCVMAAFPFDRSLQTDAIPRLRGWTAEVAMIVLTAAGFILTMVGCFAAARSMHERA